MALFALAFQMAVSFGHMHRDDLGLPPLPSFVQIQTGSVAVDAPAHPANQGDHPATPDDYCPICASMALVATALPSLPPLLIVPEPIRRVWPSEAPAHSVSLQLALSFQARGPPNADHNVD